MNRLIFIPEKAQMIAFSDGSGDNLMQEDYDAGYNDYLNYCQIAINDEMIDDFVEDYNNGDFSLEAMYDLEYLSDLIRKANPKKEDAVSQNVLDALKQFKESNEFAYDTLAYIGFKKGWNDALQVMEDWIYMYAPKLNDLEENKGLYAATALASQLNMVFRFK